MSSGEEDGDGEREHHSDGAANVTSASSVFEQDNEPAEQQRNDASTNDADPVTSSDISQKPADVRSFFERIKAQEAGKESVGTVHASGFRAPNPTSLVASEQWECVKRGCGQKNNKKAAACSKCGAMKRLSEWR